MAYTTKTSIAQRNVVVQNGQGDSTTVWLEIEHADSPKSECVALTNLEALALGRQLLAYGIEASRREIRKDDDALLAVH